MVEGQTTRDRQGNPSLNGDRETAPPLPIVPLPDQAKLPPELGHATSWIIWRAEWKKQKDGNLKLNKVPVAWNGRGHDMTDHAIWSTLGEAIGAATRLRNQHGHIYGVGIVFHDDSNFVIVDLDKVIDPQTQQSHPTAKSIWQRYPTWGELSVSGTGLHLLYLGKFDGKTKRPYRDLTVEVFGSTGFVAITGNVGDKASPPVADGAELIAEIMAPKSEGNKDYSSHSSHENKSHSLPADEIILRRMMGSRNGAKIQTLWNGGGHDDQSAGDQSLCNHLAWWTDRDAAAVDRLFRQSGRMRTKWDEPHYRDGTTYGKATINEAISKCPKGFQWNGASTPGYEDKSNEPEDKKPRPDGFQFDCITSRELDEGDFRIDWLVDYFLAAGQAGVIGAFAKSMKTTIAIALALAIGTGTAFLGKFNVRRKVRVAVLSGESGKWVIQETARRIAKSMGINLVDADVIWGFDLPQLSDLMDLAELANGLKAAGVEVVIIDPLYLCLLSGDMGPDMAKNVYGMGPHLLAIAKRCLEVGCTPILIHHSNRTIKVGEPMELQHLSGAGVAEFVRQWILLNRETAYHGDGIHKIWMTVGGSAGQGGLHLVHIDEGTAESEGGRHWDVSVFSASEANQEKKEAKKNKNDKAKEETFKADVERCYELICQLCEAKAKIAIKKQIRASEPRWSDKTVDLLVEKLLIDDRIEAKTVKPKKGRGGFRGTTEGYKPKLKKSETAF